MKENIKGEEVKNIILETVNDIADIVCSTYGPNGRTVILSKYQEDDIVTKDGVSVCNAINYKNPYKSSISKIIKQVGQKTVEEAGDGTTGSICLVNAFITKGFELIDKGIKYNEIKLALEELEDYTVKQLKKNSRKVNKSDIINIAKIASNNDLEIASIINKAYKHSKIVKVEESTLKEDTLVEVNGMSLRTTYYDAAFINDGSTNTIKYTNCKVALIEGNMETLEPIKNLIYRLDGLPLIIFADHFSDQVINILRHNYNNGSLKVALIKSPGVKQHRKNIINDISYYTKATILKANKTYNDFTYLGDIDNIEVKKEETILLKNGINIGVSSRIEELESLIKTDLPKYDIELATQRLQALKGKVSLIKVGGESPVEIKERYDRIEDAVLAVKSAYEEGIVKGGGLALKQIVDELTFTRSPILELSLCLYSCNTKLGISDIDDNVYDPTKVVRCALQNAISVAKTILGTEAIVLNEYLWNQE